MPTILVVEDESHLAIGIKFNLEQEGYQVHVVGDGQAALKALEASDPSISLVVLDLMLPGMSGYAVCEAIRDMGNTLPIVMIFEVSSSTQRPIWRPSSVTIVPGDLLASSITRRCLGSETLAVIRNSSTPALETIRLIRSTSA